MKKILPALAFILLAAACKKKERTFDTYHKYYTIQYYQNADSYITTASFTKFSTKTNGPLDEDESVTFNGQPYAELKGNVYYWYGKGKPEASFALIQGDDKIVSSMPMSDVGDYEIICPDTVSRSEKLAFRIKGIDQQQHPISLEIVSPGTESGMSVGIKGDSCYVSLYELENFYSDGAMEIFVKRRAEKVIQPMEQPGTGRIEYYLALTKPIFFKP